ncbi:MAG TPA: PQQ-binding-like beta-propeller repeat protein [Pyrinomonadaceae bacterium]
MKRFSVAALSALLVCFVVVTCAGWPSAEAKGANWPQFRGPEGQGVSSETNIPLEWDATKNVLWKTPIEGRGQSQPIIWGKHVFLTTAVAGEVVPDTKKPVYPEYGAGGKHPDSIDADRKHAFKVIAVDRDSGKVLWTRTAYEGLPSDYRHRKSSFASPTPVTDGKMVFAYFGSEGLYAYDYKGNLAWKQNVGRLVTLGMGAGTSPILHGNNVIVQADTGPEGKGSSIAAYDKKTGKEAWKVAREGMEISWSTPIIVRTKQREELITSGNQHIIAYDPATGKELWRTKGVESNAIPTPLTDGEMVFVYAGYPKKITKALKLGGSGELKEGEGVAWTYGKGAAYVPSSILLNGILYLMNDKGLITALDAKTGKAHYEGGRVPVPATFMASPVAFGGYILLTSEDGDTFVIKAGPKHEVVRTNALGEPVYVSPAIADDKLFIRADKHLYAIGKKG